MSNNSCLLYLALAAFAAHIATTTAAAAKPNCGGSSSSKNIELLQPTNPPRECIYHINAYSSNVCQLRIDFAMTLAQPTVPDEQNGLWYVQCVKDYFAVNGLKLCGTEIAQHIYVPFNRTAGVKNIDLSIVLAVRAGGGGNLPTPSWKMAVTQLECPSDAAIRSGLATLAVENEQMEAIERAVQPRAGIKDGFFVAPPDCLQYFPYATGNITSFNFNGGAGVYPGNMNYAICFRRQQSTQSLELNARYFGLGTGYQRQKFQELDNYCRPQLAAAGVSEDYLMVPQATIVDSNIRATYFCGDSIQGDIVTSTNPGPLAITFNSDGNYKAGQEVGFSLSYRVL
ncbi:uncharacterized protein LOC101455074 [Ceratitis capitata]|uniref:uncharacterized protein LOC101455074 n=1 Tax=Ceratitis capitata TaxID=7213 RepID=UPI0006188276|nr:uncharacterized protein LOC101455074 [Ceratitis capitata]